MYNKNATTNDQLVKQIAEHYEAILRLIGEDPTREGLVKTPTRAAKALLENTYGYHQDPQEILKAALFDHQGREIVVVKDIEFYSLCEHHVLPFFGTVSVGYIPDGHIVGLSKLGRVVDVFARRLQVQERLTQDICDELARTVPNKGVIVVCEAQHLCMKMRGVEKQRATTVTMHYTGEFDDEATRSQFFRLLDMGK